MRNIILTSILALLLSSCSSVIDKQPPICSAITNIGGQEQSVNIYGIRKLAGQTQYKAGYPFNWKWVSKSNFTSSTCQ